MTNDFDQIVKSHFREREDVYSVIEKYRAVTDYTRTFVK